jgi:hypothetical protein
MSPTSIVLLEFELERNDLGKGKKLRDGLSVALQIADTLWVANDETITLERLTLERGEDTDDYRYARRHRQFSLNDFLPLPIPPTDNPAETQEVDVEGLAHDGDYLWVTGSHSLKRKKPKLRDGVRKAQKQLARCDAEANRYLLARIPIVECNKTFELEKEVTKDGKTCTAAMLPVHEGSNALMDALKEDEHLAPFLSIPGKDNGFDIEGLAASGGRLFLGLRGPVLRGWAVILELTLVEDEKDASLLKLSGSGRGGRGYRKHFLGLGGLGIRDLCADGDDLLILAGPTMDLDGPVALYRWKGGAAPEEESMVAGDTLLRVMDIPYGQGVDHAEGMCLFTAHSGESKNARLLVVHDAASPNRHLGQSTLIADVFSLPG